MPVALSDPGTRRDSPEQNQAENFCLVSRSPLRDNHPPGGVRVVREICNQTRIRTGNTEFDGVHALAIEEVRECSVDWIRDTSYRRGREIPVKAFETGEMWPYVWTRDLAYALDLGLARTDPERAVESLLFKTSALKAGVDGGAAFQIIQDTGSGGSYPVSTDRCVWAIGARAAVRAMKAEERAAFRSAIAPILEGTIEQDLRLVFDPVTGLYRGEQSFLDWREQTYPLWTRENVLPIAMSQALSTNVGMVALLEFAGENARALGRDSDGVELLEHAARLREAIRRSFPDPASGLWATYLFSEDGGPSRRAGRFDLLGICLAILEGVADAETGRALLSRYPTGPHGPPVAWPLERGVPIYHNQGIWPFVTAYWLRAARHCGHGPARDAAIRSLYRLAANNLSNMENFDFRSGLADAVDGPRSGPVINSRRQLWSVAGYLAMVHEGVFGLELHDDAVGFRPALGGNLCQEIFPATRRIALQALEIRGKTHDVVLNFPGEWSSGEELTAVEVVCNGLDVGLGPLPDTALAQHNLWEIQLAAGPPAHPDLRLTTVDVTKEDGLYAPEPPSGAGIVRDPLTGWESHPGTPDVPVGIRLEGRGAFEDGVEFVPRAGGIHHIRVEFSNGHGPLNTGITCAVKRLEVRGAEGRELATGYVVMPHTGGWDQWQLSSMVAVELPAGAACVIRLTEDSYCRNMSFFSANADYTAGDGGGPLPCNSVLIAAIFIQPPEPACAP